MTKVTGQGGTAGSKPGLDERGRSAKTAQSDEGDGTVDSQTPGLTYHIKEEAHPTRLYESLCPKHADPRDTSVADPASAPCTCTGSLIHHGPQHEGPTKDMVALKPGQRRCLLCHTAKAKSAFRAHISSICQACVTKERKASDARWNAKTPEQHAADGAALFARMEARR